MDVLNALQKLFSGKGYIDGITIINLQGGILFSAKLNDKLSIQGSGEAPVGKNFYDVYENLSSNNSTTYKAMQEGVPAYVKNQYLKPVGHKGIRITSLSIPIKSGNRIVGAIDLSSEVQPEGLLSSALQIAMDTAQSPLECAGWRDSLRFTKDSIIAVNKAMVAARDYIDVVASCTLPVMLYGETGTGKEVFAQAIHNASSRKDRPFLAQNCAAIPETLLESMLFGTVRGAYTGAVDNPGLFEMADGGTLFLDEINSMPIGLQSKLLRVVQENRFCRLGSRAEISVDIRFITALNEDPMEAIANKRLRSDIYYRLSMMSIAIPPLRERLEDIPAFVKLYIQKHNSTFRKKIEFVSSELIDKLQRYSWPGNIRELEQMIVYGMSLAGADQHVLEYSDIEAKFEKLLPQEAVLSSPDPMEAPLRTAMETYERRIIAGALCQSGGNLTKAAKRLDIPRQTLQRKVKHYGLDSCLLLD